MTPALHLRPLDAHDLTSLQELLEADPGYARRVTGADPRPDEAAQLLSGRPPDVSPERKVVLGAFDDAEAMAAVIDVLRGWPDAATAHVGLLQVHGSRQRQGVGHRVHDLLLDWLRGWPEITRLRAAIVATNAPYAEPFWAAQGYQPTGKPKPYAAGDTTTEVTIWCRPYSSRPGGSGRG